MATAQIISKLKKVIDALPDNWTMKSDSVENYLIKQGVKPEELRWAELQIPEGSKLTKEDLRRIEQARTDQFTTQSDDQAFIEIGLPEAKSSMTAVQSDQWNSEAIQLARNWDNMHPFDIEEEARRLGWEGPIEGDAFRGFVSNRIDIGVPPQKWINRNNANYSADIVQFSQKGADNSDALSEQTMELFARWEAGELSTDQAYSVGIDSQLILPHVEEAVEAGELSKEEAVKGLEDAALWLREGNNRLSGDSRYDSIHFRNTPNYLYHTRGFDRELDGQPTRVVQEIQSDLHQQGRQEGYIRPAEIKESERAIQSMLKGDVEKVLRKLSRADDEQIEKLHLRPNYVKNGASKLLVGLANGSASNDDAIAYINNIRTKAFEELESIKTSITIAPESPLEKNWLRKGIEREIVRAANEGKTQIAIPISGEGTKALVRSEGVSKWYQTKVAPTAKKIAKSLGGEYKTTTDKGVDYAIIELPKDEAGKVKPFQTELYSPAAAGLGATALTVQALTEQEPEKVQAMKDAGFNDQQIATYAKQKQLVQLPDNFKQQASEAGFTEEQLAQYAAMRQPKPEQQGFPTPSEDLRWESDVPEVTESGEVTFGLETLPDDEVKRIAKDLNVNPNTQVGINLVYNSVKRQQLKGRGWADVVSEDVANFEEIANIDRPWQWFKSHFGAQADAEYRAMENEAKQAIVKMGKERGLYLYQQEGEWLVRDPNNPSRSYPVTPGLLSSLSTAKYEVAGAIAGAAAGAKMAQGFEAAGMPGRIAKMLAIGGGSVIGAVIGDQGDYLEAAIEAEQKWSQEVAFEKALGTAQATVVYDTLGYGILKSGGSVFKGIRHALNTLFTGNTSGAYKALKEAVGGISDEEAREIVQRWEKLNQQAAPGSNDKEKALAILPTTTGGGERIIAASAGIDPTASSAVINEVNARAQSLLKASAKANDPDSGKKILDDLSAYELSVKNYYDQIRTQGENLVPEEYRFELEPLAVRPMIEHQIATIEDPATVNRFVRVLDNIDAVTDSRSFSDLLELRTVVNDIKYNKRIKSKKDFDAVNESLATIDSEIRNVMNQMPDGKQWLRDWKDANSQYAKMKGVQQNKLYKTITTEGMREEDIAKKLVRYGPAIDDTYNDVITKLSPQRQKGVEDSIVDTLVNKHTLGEEGEFRAIRFPALAKELENFKFNTPDAERIKEVVSRMAEVYRNDPKLAAAAGNISMPMFQSYLTTDPRARAMYEVASASFNYIKQLVPNRKADTLAMVKKTAKLLEDPLNAKTTQQVIDAVKEDQQLVAAIRRMQSEVAKSKAAGTYRGPRTKMFKDSSGKLWMQPGTGRKEVTEEAIPTHRLIGVKEVKRRFKVKKLKSSTLTKATRKRLLDDGFAGIVLEDGQVIKLY